MKAQTLLIGAAAIGIAACSDSTGTVSYPVSVTMHQSGSIVVASGSAGVFGQVAVANVDSLFITFTSISFKPVGTEDDSTDGGWQSVTLPAPVTVDLLALPSDSDSAVVIAAGTLVEGDYEQLRFIVSASSIFFNTTLNVGNQVFDPDTEYEVTVPSGSTSGLKTDLTLSLSDSTEVNLLFSPVATLNDVTATGSGKVILKPVLRFDDP